MSAPAVTTVATARRTPARDSAAGLDRLLKLSLRRDRIMLPVWLYAVLGSTIGTAYSIRKLYPTQASRDQLRQSIDANPSLRALYGPLYDTHTLGAVTAWRVLPISALILAIFCVLLITRHTRAEEEDGRLELLGAGAIGRSAPLTAALAEAAIACVTVAVVAAAALALFGQGVAGSTAFGAVIGATGLAFAGLSAVAAQLTETGRAANGLGGAAIGAAYLLRAVGDAAGSTGALGWTSWLTPFGWAGKVHPWAGDRWWLIVLMLVVTGALVAAAYLLADHRDLGSGLLPQRPGPATAGADLRGSLGLGWRLQRGSLLGWSVAVLVMGFVLGGLTKGIQQLIDDSPQVAQVMARYGGTRGAAEIYLATSVSFLAMATAFYAVQTTLRLRSEETSGRAETVLAGDVGRLRWAGSHLLYPAFGSAVLLLVGGLGAGLGAGSVLGDTGGWAGRMLGAALVQLPAVWVFAAAGLALFGLLPKWTTAAWGVLGVLLLISYLGPALQAPQWLLDLTPFTHVPRLPGGTFSWTPLLLLTLLGAVLTAGGLAGVRRRDITS
jgi:ABC-2 type transport system permease protein